MRVGYINPAAFVFGMQRTISLTLPKYPELCDTIQEYNVIANEHISACFALETLSKVRLHHRIYHHVRAHHPQFPSGLIQCARDNAVEMLRGNRLNPYTRKRLDSSIRFDCRTLKFFMDSGELQLTTIAGRKKYRVPVPDYFKKYSSWKVQAATVGIQKKFLTLKIIVEGNLPTRIHNVDVLGIDLGIKEFAALSDGQLISAKKIHRVTRKYAYLRRELQAKGTRSAKKKLRTLSGRERRFQRHFTHSLTRYIADLPYCAFALENLKGIRTGRKGRVFNRRRSTWAYYQFRKVLEYKALEQGKMLLLVDPRYTSQTCSNCLSVDKANRKGSVFRCRECNFVSHADYNASQNISRRGCQIFFGQAVVNQPNISGKDIARRSSSGIMNRPEAKCPTALLWVG